MRLSLRTASVAAIVGLVLVACTQAPTPTPTPTATRPPTPTQESQVKQYTAPPSMALDPAKRYVATLETSEGDITIELLADEAPLTVNNFVFLARDGFYDGVTFHRIVKGFMVQSGDPTGLGTGGPGYSIPDEPVTRDYLPGTLAMANKGRPDTGGSQFFIMHQYTPLPKDYTIFGQVTEGMDVVDAIANTPVKASPTGEMSVPTRDMVIRHVEIQELP